MNNLREVLKLVLDFSSLFIPSLALFVGAWLVGPGDGQVSTRRRLLLLLLCTALALGLLVLFIWSNPYGRELNSSLPAFGMLPVLVALLVLILRQPRQLASLWTTDRPLLLGLALVFLALLGSLWIIERQTLYIVLGLTGALALIWLVASHAGWVLLTALSLFSLSTLVLLGGGSFYLPNPGGPDWLETSQNIAITLAMLLSLILSAGLVYESLRENGALQPHLGWGLALAVLLLGGSAYQVFWDGVWSSAHARAFEDHLPFAHFMLSLIAGLVIAISTRGWRRLAGPAFTILVTTLATLSLIWGWNVSAFELTATRAMRIDRAVQQFHQETGAYPLKLSALTPRYLLLLPPPVVVRQGGWCYQGADDAYRLGYVSGRFTYFEADFETAIYAQVGDPPASPWLCNELIELFKTGQAAY